MPLVFLRGFHSDEGVAVTVARAALEDGYWITPHIFNTRFVERPTLLSWIIAAISVPFGSVSEFTARLPIVLFLLAGCLLIYALLRRVGSSIPAALLGAALFLACPIVIRAYAMATADLPLAVLLFIVLRRLVGRLSRRPHQHGPMGSDRRCFGACRPPERTAAGGLFRARHRLVHSYTRSWRQIPGFILAGVLCVVPLAAWYGYVYSPGDEDQWAGFMRLSPVAPLSGPVESILSLVSETLPAVAARDRIFRLQRILRNRANSARFHQSDPVLRACSIGRHSVLARRIDGTLFLSPDPADVRARRPRLRRVGEKRAVGGRPRTYCYVCSTCLFVCLYRHCRALDAETIPVGADRRGADYRADSGRSGADLSHRQRRSECVCLVPGPIVTKDTAALKTIPGPAWIAAEPGEAQALLAARPDKLHVVMQFGQDDEWRLLRLDK